MKVLLANGTRQNRVFCYMCPKQKRQKQIAIPQGRQVEIAMDYSPVEMGLLESQLNANGAVKMNDIRSITTPYSLIYSIDTKHIASDKIDQARERDAVVRQDIAAQVTEEAGLATFATLAAPNPDKVRASSLDVEQLEDQGDEVKRRGVSYEAAVRLDAGARKDGRRRAA